jgi:hypothetical protein
VPLTRFLLVILMIVKEASYLSLQRRCLLQIPDWPAPGSKDTELGVKMHARRHAGRVPIACK